MTQLAKVDQLNEMQRSFVELVVQGVPPDEAKARAGYAETTPTVGILRSRLVKNAIREGCDAMLRGELRGLAVKTLKDLMISGPAATRFNAAKLVLELEDPEAGAEEALSAMRIEDLEALIARKEAELKNVTP